MNGIGSHQNYKMGKDEWLTPPGIIHDLGPFDLDPCAPIFRPWPMASRHYTIHDDGLLMPWEGMVWLNPPYGKYTGFWMEKLAMHGAGIALIFARTETEIFTQWVWPHASAVLFIQGRLTFFHSSGKKARGNSGAPSVLVGYGAEAFKRLKKSNIPEKFLKNT